MVGTGLSIILLALLVAVPAIQNRRIPVPNLITLKFCCHYLRSCLLSKRKEGDLDLTLPETTNNMTESDIEHQNSVPEETGNQPSQLTVNSEGQVNVIVQMGNETINMVQIGNENNINYNPMQQILNALNISSGLTTIAD